MKARHNRFLVWKGAALVLGLAAFVAPINPTMASATRGSAGTVTVYDVPGTSIAAGPDGNIWVAQTDRIAKVSMTGDVLATYPVPSLSERDRLSPGPDGRIWFGAGSGKIGAITTDGAVSTYSVPEGCDGPTTGPEQTIWLNCDGTAAGRFDIAKKKVVQFPVPNGADTSFVLGPDGNMWFGSETSSAHLIGRISPAGDDITEYDAAGSYCTSGIEDLAAGSNGTMWYSGFNDYQHCLGGSVGFFTMDGTNHHTDGHYGYNEFTGITEGPDGNMWVGDTNPSHTIWRFSPTGTSKAFPLSNYGHSTDPISGPDGRVWFVHAGADGYGIAAITTSATPVPEGTVTVYEIRGTSIAVGADGNMWVAQGTRIAKVSVSGRVLAKYQVPSDVETLSRGPDRRIWFDAGRGTIGAISIRGLVHVYAVPERCHLPTRGPGRTIWLKCGERFAGRLDIATRSVSLFPLPRGTRTTTSFVLGPDRNLWFGAAHNSSEYEVGKISPSGDVIAEYFIQSYCTHGIEDLAPGPDNTIWFSGFNDFEHCLGGSVGYVTTDGTFGDFEEGHSSSEYRGIAHGPDGNMWAGDDTLYHAIWRITPEGEWTEFPVPNSGASSDPVAGPDGRVWFVDGENVAAITTTES